MFNLSILWSAKLSYKINHHSAYPGWVGGPSHDWKPKACAAPTMYSDAGHLAEGKENGVSHIVSLRALQGSSALLALAEQVSQPYSP